MSPSGVGRETGFQGRVGRKLASVPSSSFSLLHLSPCLALHNLVVTAKCPVHF